jgi:hypothetical protein
LYAVPALAFRYKDDSVRIANPVDQPAKGLLAAMSPSLLVTGSGKRR